MSSFYFGNVKREWIRPNYSVNIVFSVALLLYRKFIDNFIQLSVFLHYIYDLVHTAAVCIETVKNQIGLLLLQYSSH